ncbi:nuclear movement protein nudC [Chiua virens]|nr:nuclear movement protein nudC [Chiua virens]
MSDDEYDKLSKEEKEAKDKADREREAAEQAALPYAWKQELGEVDIVVPVPKGTRARELVIVIQKKKLSVGLKGKDKIMDGELCKEIKLEDSTWTLGTRFVTLSSRLTIISEDQESILIHLEKLNDQQWWENVLTHHPKIDTRKIQPENSKLSDLDGETRYVIVTQMGKPTSDELKKMEALKKFQAAHPELDFSNAKIS